MEKTPQETKSGNSVDQLVERLRKDKLLRVRLISRLAETFQELGVAPSDISLIPSIDAISDDLGGGSPAQLVFVSTRDSKKNEKSIIIGGSGPKK